MEGDRTAAAVQLEGKALGHKKEGISHRDVSYRKLLCKRNPASTKKASMAAMAFFICMSSASVRPVRDVEEALAAEF
jgi:hypothetical protein